jgi:hypothetical protein
LRRSPQPSFNFQLTFQALQIQCQISGRLVSLFSLLAQSFGYDPPELSGQLAIKFSASTGGSLSKIDTTTWLGVSPAKGTRPLTIS